MAYRLLNDSKHWRERADEVRTAAELIADPTACESMHLVADAYERMAVRAEKHPVGMPGAHADGQ